MTCTVRCDDKVGIIESIYSGIVTRDDIRNAVSRRASLERETGIRKVLVDLSRTDNSEADIFDLFELPSKLYDEEKANKRSHMAIVLPKPGEVRKIVRFFEIACWNRGWTVQTFEERKPAVDWLLCYDI